MPWDIEIIGIERDDVVEGIECSVNASDFIRGCWIFDYTNRLDADWMLGYAWFKE